MLARLHWLTRIFVVTEPISLQKQRFHSSITKSLYCEKEVFIKYVNVVYCVSVILHFLFVDKWPFLSQPRWRSWVKFDWLCFESVWWPSVRSVSMQRPTLFLTSYWGGFLLTVWKNELCLLCDLGSSCEQIQISLTELCN